VFFNDGERVWLDLDELHWEYVNQGDGDITIGLNEEMEGEEGEK